MEGTHPIRAWRKNQNLTVEAAAAVLDVSKAAVSRWESGERRVGFRIVRDVASKTGIPARVLRPDLADVLGAE